VTGSSWKALAGGVLFVSAFLGAHLVAQLAAGTDGGPRAQTFPDFEIPASPEYFFAHPNHTELSQSILYHGLGASIANARRADVLLIGNSRLPLGLREEILVPAAERLGLRLFSLGCGHAELVRFPLEVIVKHDLRPEVVVVSGGPHLFYDEMSEVAREALAMTRWDAAKQWLEVAGGWNLQIRLHALAPKLDFFDRPLHPSTILYRSARTGWWKPVVEPAGRYPVRPGEDIHPYDALIPMAARLERELRARGALLVLTMVPYDGAPTGHLRFLAKELAVPAVVPSFDGMFTSDGSHLDRDSAERLSTRFWSQFVALPQVRRALSLDAGPQPE
jgi:hypothetical protein